MVDAPKQAPVLSERIIPLRQTEEEKKKGKEKPDSRSKKGTEPTNR